MSELTEQKAAELRKPFPANVIGKLPKGGTTLDYVGHAAVTDRLLAVDPYWSWEPMATTEAGLPALDNAGNLWIRLTICGVTRIGVGDGKNAKEVIGDAIRNAAMRFGVALDLWSKDELEQVTTGAEKLRAALHGGGLAAALAQTDDGAASDAPDSDRDVETPSQAAPSSPSEPITAPQLKKLHVMLPKVGLTDRDEALAYYARVTGTVVESSKELTKAEAGMVIDDLERAEKGEPSVLAEMRAEQGTLPVGGAE